jgi:hypothetical protein
VVVVLRSTYADAGSVATCMFLVFWSLLELMETR